MENLDIAIRRYQQLVPEPSSHLWHPGILRKLRVWLTDDVGPIAESLSRRPAFRERATWSLRVFKPGADTPERRAVDAMAGSLVRCAQIQLRLLGKKRLQKELARQNSPAVAAIEGGIEITGDESRATVLRHEPFDHLALEISQLESLAGGGPPNLADVNDYFGPQQEFSDGPDGPIQSADLIVSFNAELRTVGDFIVKAMFRRIDRLLDTLTAIHRKIHVATAARKVKSKDQAAADSQYQDVQEKLAALRTLCETGSEYSLRRACIVMTQLVAAFRPGVDLAWLGLPARAQEAAVESMRGRITSFQNGEMFECIVAALIELKQLYVEEPLGQAELELAIGAGHLVVDTQNCRLYWNREEVIRKEWKTDSKPWQLLVALATKVRHQASVVEGDLYGDDVTSVSTLATLVSRVKISLPADLRALIESGQSPRSYRLNLEPHRVLITPRPAK